jgi:serine/threonine-protein kinase
MNEVCNRFEAAWKAGHQPRIEDYLEDASADQREPLLPELVGLELDYRRLRGEAPALGEFTQRFPEHAHTLRRLWEEIPPSEALSLPKAPAVEDNQALRDGSHSPLDERYEFVDEIGGGGMGVVFRVRDRKLQRELAIKVLREKYEGRREFEERFRREAQICGQLQHPNIVPVHELDQLADGRLFFTMKLVQGRTLASLLKERKEPAQDRERFLAVFEQVAQALAYAHSRGIMHRDLKPANVMLGAFGEVQVMDWGLAKVVGEHLAVGSAALSSVPETAITASASGAADGGARTQPGQVLGTLAYMPPEQARGEIDQLDERSDVFGLGAILHEILTGQPPFTGATNEEVYQKARDGDLTEAFTHLDACGADGEMVGLTKACLAVESQERPRTAKVVAQEITAYLTTAAERLRAAELAAAQATARVEQERETAAQERKARRLAVGMAASVLGMLLAGGGGWFWIVHQHEVHAATTAQQVRDTIAEVTTLRDQRKWADALAAAKPLEVLLETGELDKGTQRSVRDFLENVRLLELLAEVRTRKGIEYGASEVDMDSEYSWVFKEFDLDVDTLTVEEAAARIRSKPPGVAVELAAALDAWAPERWRAKPKDPGWQRLVDVARMADPDPWRNRLRDQFGHIDLRALRNLAKSADDTDRPVQSWELLAQAFAGAGSYHEAVHWLRIGQQHHPGDIWVNFYLGLLLANFLNPPQPEEAIRYYTVAAALRPDIRHHLAHVLERQGKPDEAIAHFKELARLKPLIDQHHYCLGNALANAGRPEEAMACYRQALRINPEFAAANAALGKSLKKIGKVWEAIAAYKEAVRLEPKYAEAHTNLGSALVEAGKWDEGVEHYQQAIRINSKLFEPQFNLGRALQEKGKWKDAIDQYRKVLLVKPDSDEAYYCIGFILAEIGRRDEAIDHYEHVLRINPKNACAHTNLGNLLSAAGRRNEAIDHYQHALQINPDLLEAHYSLGEALLACGRLEEATDHCQDALRINPKHAQCHDLLGKILTNIGRLDEAIAAFKEAIRLMPDFAEAHYGLGIALVMVGKRDEAIDHYRKAIKLKPDFAEAHCNLGYNLRTLGHLAEGLESLKQGHKLGQKKPSWDYPSGRWVQEAEDLIALDRKLPSFLRGEKKPTNPAECLALADLCQQPFQRQYAAATRFYAEAFAAEPRLAEDLRNGKRYAAACAAAKAGCGQG